MWLSNFFPNAKCFVRTAIPSWMNRWACCPQTLPRIGIRMRFQSQLAFANRVIQCYIITRVNTGSLSLSLDVDPEDIVLTLVFVIKSMMSSGVPRTFRFGTGGRFHTIQPIIVNRISRGINAHGIPAKHWPRTGCFVNPEDCSRTFGPVRPWHFHRWAVLWWWLTIPAWTPQPNVSVVGLQPNGVSRIDSYKGENVMQHVYNSKALFTPGVLIGFNPLLVAKPVPIHQWMWIESIRIEPDWWAFTLEANWA